MRLELPIGEVRSWRATDVQSLARYANNRNVWINLRDVFPHPYDENDARNFIGLALEMRPETFFAIAVEDQAVGGIGLMLRSDVERVSAEIGYWLGEPFWGRGIMTAAVRAVTRYSIEHHQL